MKTCWKLDVYANNISMNHRKCNTMPFNVYRVSNRIGNPFFDLRFSCIETSITNFHCYIQPFNHKILKQKQQKWLHKWCMDNDAKYQEKILIYVISMAKRNCDFAPSTSKNRFSILVLSRFPFIFKHTWKVTKCLETCISLFGHKIIHGRRCYN